MPERTLKQRIKVYVHKLLNSLNAMYLRKIRGVDIGEYSKINRRAKIDGINPKGVHLGNYVQISQNAVVLAHDSYHDGRYCDTIM